MCGILGYVGFDSSDTKMTATRFYKALNLIKHRGPDDEGILLSNSNTKELIPCAGDDSDSNLKLVHVKTYSDVENDLVFGHRRLSIIDISTAGHQPMRAHNDDFWIIFNGEVYNYLELKSDLEQKGVEFITHADTEVVLKAYIYWGADCLTRFKGMFAFSIFDVKNRKVFCARDHFGIKPFYYSYTPDGIAFSSEIKPLLDISTEKPKANPKTLFKYLRYSLIDDSEETMFNNIYELPQASYMVIDMAKAERPKVQKYWELSLNKSWQDSKSAAALKLKELFQQSVLMHMRSDVELATCLSGGLDSTAILAVMYKNYDRIKTFSFIDSNEELSEKKFIEIAQSHFKVEGHEAIIDNDRFVREIEKLVKIQEQPFSSLSIYSQYLLFEKAKSENIKVMLDGQGSDEMFGGYANFVGAKMTGLICQFKLNSLLKVINNSRARLRTNVPKLFLTSLARMLPLKVIYSLGMFSKEKYIPDWLSGQWFEKRGVKKVYRFYGTGKDALRQEMKYALTKGSLPQLLRFEDRNSMASSIEARVPFCNVDIAEFSYSLSDKLLVSDQGETKYILKKAMEGTVPNEIIYRKKVGFETSQQEIIGKLKPYLKELFDDFSNRKDTFLSPKFEENVFNELDHAKKLPAHIWRIINVLIWIKVFDVEI